MSPKILIVDDEAELVRAFTRMLSQEAYEIECAYSGESALEVIDRGGIELMLIDVQMSKMSGLDVLTWMRERNTQIPTIVISGAGSVDVAVQAIKLGAVDFIQKPVHAERLLLTVRNALRYVSLQEAHQQLQADHVLGTPLIGEAPAMRRLKELVAKVAPSDGRVLITGENGTGKELVAAALHAGSARASRPFVKLNCGAVANELVESELFGHEKGSFTGAIAARKGRFELADGGTLLLDEIGDMPMPMQVKLLRVLQEGQLERVGGTRSVQVDVRVLAATNRDLSAMVEDGSFREDLFYRLNVLTLRAPPLRERREDIPLLARHFTRPGARGAGLSLSDSALSALARYDFPGNVRELQNLIERLAILHAGETIEATHVQEVLAGNGKSRAARGALYQFGAQLKDLLHDLERQIIVEAIAANGNSKSAAAAALGTERSHFYKKCRQHGISGQEG
jgi:DNA-binding NtrC family response regulator